MAVLPQAEDVEVAIRDEDLRIDTYRCARLAVLASGRSAALARCQVVAIHNAGLCILICQAHMTA